MQKIISFPPTEMSTMSAMRAAQNRLRKLKFREYLAFLSFYALFRDEQVIYEFCGIKQRKQCFHTKRQTSCLGKHDVLTAIIFAVVSMQILLLNRPEFLWQRLRAMMCMYAPCHAPRYTGRCIRRIIQYLAQTWVELDHLMTFAYYSSYLKVKVADMKL